MRNRQKTAGGPAFWLLAGVMASIWVGCNSQPAVSPDGALDSEDAPTYEEEAATFDDGGPADELADEGYDATDGADLYEDAAPDGGEEPADAADAEDAEDGGDIDCSGTGPFDYHCEMTEPETCPGGMCLLGMCIAPVLDPDRWLDCGDGACGVCENESICPADCAEPPVFTGFKEYDSSTTITVWLHGFYNKSPDEMASMVYGEFGSCGGILGSFTDYGVDRPCGNIPPGETAPNQLVKVEYYGGVPAAWLTQADIDEIEQFAYDGPDALERYARVSAKAIRYKLSASGATHVNLACHSFGCLISRHLIEHDMEGLASENRFVRWFTSAGVIAGARLARLYDNPTVRDTAELIGLELSDFVVMHPDFVADNTCRWDHRLYQGNNPLLSGMIIHHATATDPHIQDALGIALLDLNNPGDEPNDGIMYTDDERFHVMADGVVLQAPSGRRLQPGQNCVYLDHMHLPEGQAAALLATATLFHRRRVIIALEEVELLKDREHHEPLDGENGDPPAELAAAVEVRYDPYVHDTFGRDVLVHQTTVEHRSLEWFVQEQGTILQPGYLLYQGPLFDDMQELHLSFELLELDWYPRAGVREWAFDAHQALYGFDEQVPLQDALLQRQNEYVRVALRIEVIDQY